MNNISNETLEILEAYKRTSSDVINKIENNMTYVETLLIYEIMNSNFFNKDKIFFNYQLFSKLTIKKYSKLYNKDLKMLKTDLIESLNRDLRFANDKIVEKNINDMLIILDKPIEKNFEEKCQIMIDNFQLSLDEIVESNSSLMSTQELPNSFSDEISDRNLDVKIQEEAQKIAEQKKKEEAQKIAEQKKKEEAQKIAEQEEEKRRIIKEKELKLQAKRDEIQKREEEIRLQKEAIKKENKEVESMLGAIDNIYDEISAADIEDIDYTTFLNYIEEEDDIEVDDLIKDATPSKSKKMDSDLKLNELEKEKAVENHLNDISKTLNDINEVNFNTDNDLDDLEDILNTEPTNEVGALKDNITNDQTIDDLDFSIDDLDSILEEIGNNSDEVVEKNADDIEKELLDSIDLEDINNVSDTLGDIDDIESLLEELEEIPEVKESKKEKKKKKFNFMKK